MNEEDIQEVWRSCDCVCFDVDSTLCTDEGIDNLATFCGVGKEVIAWTNKAMGGSVTFQESLAARLAIINPSKQIMEKFLESQSPSLTPGVSEVIKKLKSRGCDVYLVSGRMEEIIRPAAKLLGIPVENIYANRLKYYFDGSYAGFDETAPTSRTGGKPKVISLLKEKYNYKRLVMIGDGATDLEACPPADAFIGFGGNVVRQKVKENARWFVTSFKELLDQL